jgi:hypothetical protein
MSNDARKCKLCGKPLSAYNLTSTCFCHSFRESDELFLEPFAEEAPPAADRGASFRRTYRQFNGANP